MCISDTNHNQSVHRIFEENAFLFPDKTALVFNDIVFTYSQLNEKSNQLADYLKTGYSIKHSDVIGILSEPSEWIIISMLAILKCGAVYLPLSERIPPERINYMINDADARIILGTQSLLRNIQHECPQLIFENLNDRLVGLPTSNFDSLSSPSDLAYIMYTSGTTGIPNGVEIPHRGIINLVHNADHFHLNEPQTFLQMATITFDASTFEIWGALLNGHPLILYPYNNIDFQDLDILLSKFSVSYMILITPVFNIIADEYPQILGRLKTIIIGGDVISVEHVRKVQKKYPDLKLFNAYGPTECTTIACYFPIPNIEGLNLVTIPIGKPINKTQLYLLNDDLRITESGEIGELFIGGEGQAIGYRNQKELTHEKFIKNPFSDNNNELIYKTGDLCRMLPTGDLEFIGRKDFQLKIRGFRVEINEIESTIKKDITISQCLVVGMKKELDTELIAYITGYDQKTSMPAGTICHSIDLQALKTSLLKWLPDYMVPNRLIEINRFPLNANSKIDRSKLPLSDTTPLEIQVDQNMTNDQLLIKEVWTEIFIQQNIGLDDNFFELGGHSLQLTKMIYKINKIFSVSVPIKEFYVNPTISHLSTIIYNFPIETENLLQSIVLSSNLPVPLSPSQEQLWVFNELNKGSHVYNVALRIELSGNLKPGLLEMALNELLKKQEALRTSFITTNESASQIINSFGPVQLDMSDVSDRTAQEIDNLLLENAIIPFNLEDPSLIRWKLFKIANDRYILFVNVHHIVFDGWSLGIFNKEIGDYYNALDYGFPLPTNANPINYSHYAVWQMKMVASNHFQKHLEYWKQKIGENPQPTELYPDFDRPALLTYNGWVHESQFDGVFLAELKSFTKTNKISLYLFLLSAFNILLSRYTNKTKIIIGSPYHNRSNPEIQNMIGMFINNLVISGDLSGNPTFLDFLERMRITYQEAIEHQSIPFEQLIKQLVTNRDAGRQPIFQILFVLQNASSHQLRLNGLSVHQKEIDTLTSKYDLSFFAEEVNDQLNLKIEYNTNLFEPLTIKRLLKNYIELLHSIVQDPTQRISDLNLLHHEERGELKNHPEPEESFDYNKTITQLFEEQVSKTPEQIALIFQDKKFTFTEINIRANQLAGHLLEKGPWQKDKFVGILMERSDNLLIGLLAVLKAGAAYLPLDHNYPEDRISYMIENGKVGLVICDNNTESKLRTIKGDFEIINIINYSKSISYTHNPIDRNNPDDLAYCLYTSGSTGKPKGVLIEHRSVVNLIDGVFKHTKMQGLQRILCLTTFSFDMFVVESLLPLLKGITIVMADETDNLEPDNISNLIAQHNIDIIHATRSRMDWIMSSQYAESALRKVKQILLGGESLPIKLAQRLKQFPNLKLFNMYGPTETTVYSTFKEITTNKITIGHPIQNNRVYVLDRYRNLCPIGVHGELAIGGISLARGYLNNSIITNEKFINSPFDPGERLYLTGDLARKLSNGELEHLGRLDTQVKIRGFRIELNEIENALSNIEGINDCVVTAQTINLQEELIAYIVHNSISFPTQPDQIKSELAYIKTSLRTKLPGYMVPSHFVLLERFPLNSNGKLDKKKLPIPTYSPVYSEDPNEISLSPTEKEILEIWRTLLLNDQISVYDNFFELGGHSLQLTKMIYKINKIFSVSVPIKEFLVNPTISHLSTIIYQFPNETENLLESITLSSNLPVPLSPSQEMMWVFNELNKGNQVYNIVLRIDLSGNLKPRLLDIALNELLKRQEALRTSFITTNGTTSQIINSFRPVPLEMSDVSNRTAQEIDNLLLENAIIPFNLEDPCLIRWKLFKIANERFILLVNVHHIVFDGWSQGIFNKEIGECYNALDYGFPLPNNAKPIQYSHYAVWQRNLVESNHFQVHLEYWKQKIGNNPPPTELYSDFDRPALLTYNGQVHESLLDEAFLAELKAFTKTNKISLYLFLLTAFNILLSRYTNKEQIIIGSPYHNRSNPDIQDIIGVFINNMVIASDLTENPTFLDFLERMRITYQEAIEHQSIPFEQLINHLVTHRDAGRQPIFQILFVLQNASSHQLRLNGLSVQQKEINTLTSKCDLSLYAEQVNDQLNLKIEYNTDLFEPLTINRLLKNYITLLSSIIQDPTLRISEFNLLHDEEREELQNHSEPEESFDYNKTITQLFEEQVDKTPEQIALVFQDKKFTFSEINIRANQLAGHLLEKKPLQSDKLVGIMMERSDDLLVGLLAVLKTGAAYLPIDPNYPSDRISYMIEDGKITLVICDYNTESTLSNIKGDFEVINALNYSNSKTNLQNPIDKNKPDDLAYCIYTSGSTGKPKGVMIEHRSVVNLVDGVFKHTNMQPVQTILCLTTFSFDMFVVESILPLLKGLTIIMADETDNLEPDSISNLIAKHNIDIIQVTPSRMDWMMSSRYAESALGKVKKILLGGESLPIKLALRLKQFTTVKLYNMYGPTETTVYSTFKEISNHKITIGHPIQNNKVYVLDRYRNLCPFGVPGELAIGGISLARGYLNNSIITNEKFITSPFAPGEKLYLTGDLARKLSNGELEHLGRLDTQVKIRGYRIELNEIENALSIIDGIKDCVVTAQTINSQEDLVAYIIHNSISVPTQPEQIKSELANIKTSLRTKLPGYMVPTHFVLLERFPLNSNGKIDKKKLPIPTYAPVAADKSDEISLSPTEKELLEIWRNLLLNDYISINDNFFELGGHSLLAIKLISIVNQAFNCSLTPKDIFKSPTIATLAKAIENTVLKSVSAKNLVKIHDGIGENIFLVPGIDGDAYSFFNLGKYSELNNTLYSLEYPKPKEDNLTFDTMQDLALYFIEKIKIIQPTGRYNLVGYSFGGRLVFEMAIQLQKTGNEIGLLTMIDTVGFTKLFDYKSGIIINAFEQFYIFSTLGISEKMNYLKYRLSFMLKSLFLRVTSVRSPLIQSEENDSDFMDNTMSILNNYETKNIFNGNIYLIKSSLSIYPKSRKTYYLNVLYPSLYWNKNIKGNINITSIECGHFDFLKLENIDKIIRVLDGYFKIKS